MRLSYIIRFFILVFLAEGNTLVAQQKWSLNQCISYAIENNTDIRQYEIKEKIAQESLNQSRRDLLPGISASTNAGMSFGRSVDPNTNDIVNTGFFNNSYNISSSVTIFDGFRLQNRIQYEKFREKTSEYNRLDAIDDLAFRVMNAFFDVVYYKGMLDIAREQVEVSKLSLKATERQVSLGLMAQSDLLEMKANLETEELRLIQMANSLNSAMLGLRQNMNIGITTELEIIAEPVLTAPGIVPSGDQLFDNFTGWSPYYQSLVNQLKASEKMLSASRSELYPTVSAGGSISTGYYETYKDNTGNVIGFGDQFKNNKSQYLGASLSIPVFSRWHNRSGVKQAKLEVELAKAKIESERQKLYFEMSQNLNDLEAFGKEYLQYEKQKEADQLAFRAAEQKLEQGLVSVIDFYLVKNRFANSQSQALRSKLQLEIKQKTLDFYMGKRFWE
ncbi:MAG: TolC family protein [Prolixibacteraceae bacterium]|jgi:outer membrane protein|nr:TolC family protein [Prolixibacteraceae bacterium]